MKKKITYTHGSLILVGIVGFISALFFLLAPLHEIWHWTITILSGHKATMHWSYTYTEYRGLVMLLSGAYGELLGFGLIFALAIWKNKIYLAAFMLGYMVYNLVIFTSGWWIEGWMIGDFVKAVTYHRNQEGLIIVAYRVLQVLNYLWVLVASAFMYEQRQYMEKMGRYKEKTEKRKVNLGTYEGIFGKKIL